jgi:hypothetical protein
LEFITKKQIQREVKRNKSTKADNPRRKRENKKQGVKKQ